MAGPGGGGFGGGGGRGFGGGGGGFGGGGGRGFGGGYHHHHHYGGFGFFRPRYYYGGGGCLGGLFGLIFAPIIVIVMAAALLIGSISSMVTDISRGGSYKWDEQALQAYAAEQYSAIYGAQDATYEDNIMILFLAEPEEAYTYAYIGWVGDNIEESVSDMFGDGRTALGRAFDAKIPDMYKNSLSKNLAGVVSAMEAAVGEGDHFITEPITAAVTPTLVNHSSIDINEVTVRNALASFDMTTGISMSIVVADLDAVFDKGLNGSTIVMLIVGIALLALAVFLIVRAVKQKRNGGGPRGGDGNDNGGAGGFGGGSNYRDNPYNNMRF